MAAKSSQSDPSAPPAEDQKAAKAEARTKAQAEGLRANLRRRKDQARRIEENRSRDGDQTQKDTE